MILYYNCDNPVAVITSNVIRPSKIFTGVSLSDWSELGSHGPFKITFNAKKFKAIRVLYWDIVKQRIKFNDGLIEKIEKDYYAINQDGETVSEIEYHKLQDAYISMHGEEFITRVWKREMFKDEREWFCPTAINFELSQIINITFMTNSPVIRPTLTKRYRRELQQLFGDRYIERRVDDPRISRRPDWKKLV